MLDLILSMSLRLPRQFRGARLKARLGAGAVLVACGLVQAQTPIPAQAPAAKPASPATSPPARSPAAATPHVIRPSATLGPPAPGFPSAGGPAAAARITGVARYRSVAKPEAVMFDAPSERAKKIFIAPQGMPVEVISVLRNWVKVRDPLGDLAWINRDDLTDRRMVIAIEATPLRREAQDLAPAWFSVDRGVVLELLEERPVGGFLKVRYAEGQVGYIRPDRVWGL